MTTLGIAAAPTEVVAVILDETGPRARSEVPDDTGSPDAVWRAVLRATAALLEQGGAGPTLLGLTTRTPVCVMWDVETLGCPLPLAPGTQLAPWLEGVARTSPRTLALLHEGQYAVGSLASYLLARGTRGTHHLTDATHDAALGPAPPDLPAWCRPELLPGPEGPAAGGGVPLDVRSFVGLDLRLTALRADLTAAEVARLARAAG